MENDSNNTTAKKTQHRTLPKRNMFNICNWLYVRAHKANRCLHSIANTFSSNPFSLHPLPIRLTYLDGMRMNFNWKTKKQVALQHCNRIKYQLDIADVIDMYYSRTLRFHLYSRPQHAVPKSSTNTIWNILFMCQNVARTKDTSFSYSRPPNGKKFARNAQRIQSSIWHWSCFLRSRIDKGIFGSLLFLDIFEELEYGVVINSVTNYGSHYVHIVWSICRHGDVISKIWCTLDGWCALASCAFGHWYGRLNVRVGKEHCYYSFSGFTYSTYTTISWRFFFLIRPLQSTPRIVKESCIIVTTMKYLWFLHASKFSISTRHMYPTCLAPYTVSMFFQIALRHISLWWHRKLSGRAPENIKAHDIVTCLRWLLWKGRKKVKLQWNRKWSVYVCLWVVSNV